jgi:hypothetical protein
MLFLSARRIADEKIGDQEQRNPTRADAHQQDLQSWLLRLCRWSADIPVGGSRASLPALTRLHGCRRTAGKDACAPAEDSRYNVSLETRFSLFGL